MRRNDNYFLNKSFGKLKVISLDKIVNKHAYYKCVCECGNETSVRSDFLKFGHTQSCGCLFKKYGGNVKNDKLYRLYRGILQRTTKLRKDNHNHTYIEHNITMCEEWKNDFSLFKEWALNNGYDYSKSKKEQTIDRIDNSKGYSPNNCRFISLSENNKNRNIKKGILCLTLENQKEIVKLYSCGFSSRKLGEKFNVSKTTIMKIIHNLTREELEDVGYVG